MKVQMMTKERKIQSGATVVSPTLRKTTIHIDGSGNQIDPRTKQIIQSNNDKD